MSYPEAIRKMKASQICHIGMIVKECADCGADLREFKRVRVMTAEEIIKERRG